MPKVLTNYQIKILAALLMVIDHVGLVFFPQLVVLRFIGRLSFPLFAWLLTQGEAHTRNIWRYGIRLFVLGLISQPFYWLTFESNSFNILFTLLLGLVGLRVARSRPVLEFPVWISCGFLAEAINVDYGLYGIALIALIGRLQISPLWWMLWLSLHLLAVGLPTLGAFQFPAVATPLIWLAANHQLGAKARWFYLFYPVHLFIIWLVKLGLEGALP